MMDALPVFDIATDDDTPTVNCVSLEPPNFPDFIRPYSKNNFSLINFNIRSCRQNFASFIAFLSTYFTILKLSVVVLCETWLSESSDCGFDLPGYSQVNLYRNNHGGGIKAYCNNDYKIELVNFLTFLNNVIEVLSFYVIGNNFKYLMIAIYRPPSSCPRMFNDILINQILSRIPLNTDVIITGDINFNLFNPLNLNYITEYINNLLSFNLFPVITRPSKININNITSRFTLIDHIWANFKSGINHVSGVIHNCITDHFPVFYSFQLLNRISAKTIKYRYIDRRKINSFIAHVNQMDFTQVFNAVCPGSAFELFHDKLFDCYNRIFSIKKKRITNNKIKSPWMTHKLRLCIRKKYKLFNLMKRGLVTRRDFNVYKNLLRWAVNKSKQMYNVRNFMKSKNSMKDTWKNINNILGRKKTNHDVTLIANNGIKFNGSVVCSKFSEYFSNVASDLVRNIPSAINYNYFSYLYNNLLTCFLLPTSIFEVDEILMSLDNKGNSLFNINLIFLNQSQTSLYLH